jgi:hypothetical protein
VNGSKRLWVGPAVAGLTLAGLSAAVLYLESRSISTPVADECARVWNADENRPNQGIAAEEGLSEAIVYGWLAENRYPGCAVTFLDGEGRPWLSFSRFMNAETPPGRWDVARGQRWGVDSPDGPHTVTNAQGSSDGTVVLDS